jgi:hypothetical protein
MELGKEGGTVVGKGKHDQTYFYFGIINRSINKYP